MNKEKRVVGYEAGICPKCGAKIGEDDWGESTMDIEVDFFFTCPKCGGKGYEAYEFRSIHMIEEA